MDRLTENDHCRLWKSVGCVPKCDVNAYSLSLYSLVDTRHF